MIDVDLSNNTLNDKGPIYPRIPPSACWASAMVRRPSWHYGAMNLDSIPLFSVHGCHPSSIRDHEHTHPKRVRLRRCCPLGKHHRTLKTPRRARRTSLGPNGRKARHRSTPTTNARPVGHSHVLYRSLALNTRRTSGPPRAQEEETRYRKSSADTRWHRGPPKR